jgi:CubicO group peptidase (beta-lactamase class C family)
METQNTQSDAETNSVSIPAQKRYRRAARYSENNNGLAMVVVESGQVVFEHYASGVNPGQGNPLASGTKSFSAAIALLGIQDGLLTLDEPVANTISEWNDDEEKSQISIRQLLTLTSGIRGGEMGQVPSYSEAIAKPVIASSVPRFRYGPSPFQIFGEVMVRKLAARGITETLLDYLDSRLLQAIGLQSDSWRQQKRYPDLPLSAQNSRQPNLPSGAIISAREWAKYGVLILNQGQWQGQQLLDATLLQQCFQGTEANPAYGLTFWLNKDGLDPFGNPMKRIPIASESMVMALGSGDQDMFMIPEQNLVVVRQGRLNVETLPETEPEEPGGFDRETFLNLVLTGAK